MSPNKPLPGPYQLDPWQSQITKLQWGGTSASFDGQVAGPTLSQFGRGFVPATCASAGLVSPPAEQSQVIRFNFEPRELIPPDVDGPDLMNATWEGLTSGEEWVPITFCQDYRCGSFRPGDPGEGEFWTSNDPGDEWVAGIFEHDYLCSLDYTVGATRATLTFWIKFNVYLNAGWSWQSGETVRITV